MTLMLTLFSILSTERERERSVLWQLLMPRISESEPAPWQLGFVHTQCDRPLREHLPKQNIVAPSNVEQLYHYMTDE